MPRQIAVIFEYDAPFPSLKGDGNSRASFIEEVLKTEKTSKEEYKGRMNIASKKAMKQK